MNSQTLTIKLDRTIRSYLDLPDVRKTLGVDSAISGAFETCSNPVNQAFESNLDVNFPTKYQIAGLLDRGVRVLIYVGANDWGCNWVCSFTDPDRLPKLAL